MNANPPTGQGRVNIWLDKTEYMLVPGEITTILLTLRNQSLESDRFSLAVDGIPTAWVSASQAALSLTPGEELQTALYIQAPTLGKLESGEIQITIRATSQQHPELYAESQGTLSILRSFAQPCVAVEMESAHFSVSPGGSTTFTLRLTNQGENPDSYRLLIDGIPSGWVSTPSPVVDLESGETREIPLTISPPRASESRAGRHPITIQAISQNFPDQTTVQDGILTIGVFVQFQSELQPTPPLNASQNVHINVTNQGNINESFRIIWESQDDMLAFELWNQEGQDGYFEEIQDHALRVGSGKQTSSVQELLAKINPDSKDFSDLATFDTGKIMGYVGSILGGVAGALSGVVMVLMVLIFMLLATPGISSKLKFDFNHESPGMKRVTGLVNDLRQYVGITTWINFLVGLVNTVLLFVLGVDFPVLWGLLAFLLGYIPTVGFWLALIPPTILAFLEFGAAKALIVFVGYVVINGGVQNFIQPKLMGDGLNLSPLFVVLSLFFWSWILGPMGALLAIPLTMVVKDGFLDAFDETRGLSDLMSSAGAPSQEPAVEDAAN